MIAGDVLAELLANLHKADPERMARAADQGYDTSKIMLHGTGNDVKEFVPSKSVGNTSWFTSNPAEANEDQQSWQEMLKGMMAKPAAQYVTGAPNRFVHELADSVNNINDSLADMFREDSRPTTWQSNAKDIGNIGLNAVEVVPNAAFNAMAEPIVSQLISRPPQGEQTPGEEP